MFFTIFGNSNALVLSTYSSIDSKFLDEKEAQNKFGMITKKYINKFVKSPVKNHIGKKWIKHQMILRGKK